MRNCISKRRWQQYNHCLSPLSPSTTKISVANGQEITPIGRWYGTIRIGQIGAPSSFEVFESNGAFDIILGKPWLKAVKAIHDYDTDEITISHNGQSEVITNSLATTKRPSEPIEAISEYQTSKTPTETSPADQFDKEWTRIHQIRASTFPWQETRWAQHLLVEPLDDDEDEDEVTADATKSNQTLSKKDRRLRRANTTRDQREVEGEILLANAI